MTEATAAAGTLLLIDDDEVTLRLLKVNLERPRERAKLVNDPVYLGLKAHMLDLLGRVLAH